MALVDKYVDIHKDEDSRLLWASLNRTEEIIVPVSGLSAPLLLLLRVVTYGS